MSVILQLTYLCIMIADYQIPEPFLFNPLKHHLGFIKNFVNSRTEESDNDIKNLVRELKHIGTSVMDIYTGSLPVKNICYEISEFLRQNCLYESVSFSRWTGTDVKSFRIISVSDESQWTIKYNSNNFRYIHIFPARNSRQTFRIKSNTLKSALLYYIVSGKDFITSENLNRARILMGLPPVKDTFDTEAILEMIEILRNNI